jgi:hypothetical protein
MQPLRSFVLALAALAPVVSTAAVEAVNPTKTPGSVSTAKMDAETQKELSDDQKQREKQLKKLNAASAVGYDGSAIERATRKTLDKVDENQRKAIEAAGQEP